MPDTIDLRTINWKWFGAINWHEYDVETQMFEIEFTDGVRLTVPREQVQFLKVTPAKEEAADT